MRIVNYNIKIFSVQIYYFPLWGVTWPRIFSGPIVSGRQLGIKSYHNCWLTSVAFGYDLPFPDWSSLSPIPEISKIETLITWRFRNEVVGYAVRYMLEITAWLAPLRKSSTFDLSSNCAAASSELTLAHYCLWDTRPRVFFSVFEFICRSITYGR